MNFLKIPKEDQYKVYTYFTGRIFKLGIAYLSPLPKHVRGKRDRFNSFNIYEDGAKIKWKDFGRGGEFGGDIFDFIEVMHDAINSFDQAVTFFKDTILKSRTLTDEILIEQERAYKTAAATKKEPRVETDQRFTYYELEVWQKKLLIPKSKLIAERIYGLRGIDWGNGLSNPSTEDDPAFLYDLSEANDFSSWKAYRPLTKDKKQKWKSWNLKNIPFEGYYLLPEKNETLMFTSGKKDGMVASIAYNNPNISYGNPTAEGSYQSIVKHKDELNSRFPNIRILFDGDAAGIKAANLMSELTGWEPIFLNYPKCTGVRLSFRQREGLPEETKDLAEIVENYNYNTLREFLPLL